MMLSLDSLIRRFLHETATATVQLPDTAICEHKLVLKGIIEQNPDQAARAMQDHLDSSHKEFVEILSKSQHKRMNYESKRFN